MIGWIVRWTMAIGLLAGAIYLCFTVGAAWLAIAVGVLALLITMLAMAPSGGSVSHYRYHDDDDDDTEA